MTLGKFMIRKLKWVYSTGRDAVKQKNKNGSINSNSNSNSNNDTLCGS